LLMDIPVAGQGVLGHQVKGFSGYVGDLSPASRMRQTAAAMSHA